MRKFVSVRSRLIPLPVKDVDTDMIIPAQYLTSISKDGYGANLFRRLRDADPDFVTERKEYQNARILLADANFGCGSSREHAVWALQDAGIEVVVAKSFADIFFNNALKNGLVALSLDPVVVDHLFGLAAAGELIEGEVNLERQILSVGDMKTGFDFDPFRKHCIMNGVDDLDYILSHRDAIARHFAGRPSRTFFSLDLLTAEEAG